MPRLRRVVAIERLLLEHLDVLETMGPEGFLEFRDPLEPASGFQSVQFRRIEWISGLRDTFPADAEPPPGRPLRGVRACAGLPEDREARLDALARPLPRPRGRPAARLALPRSPSCSSTTTRAIALWRHHHVLMAAREIGTRPGTGGSPGVPYLKTTLDRRFFPELWDVRVATVSRRQAAPRRHPACDAATRSDRMSESLNYVNRSSTRRTRTSPRTPAVR